MEMDRTPIYTKRSSRINQIYTKINIKKNKNKEDKDNRYTLCNAIPNLVALHNFLNKT